MNYKGTAHKVGEHIDTDAIIPARFLVTSDAKELGANCMAGLEPDWVKRVKPGDIMVAEEFRERHLEENLLRELGDYLREHRRRESRVMIRTDRAYAEVCRKHGFKYVDEDYEVIMKG